ncbi:MAG TPA: tetratricopeptide repeat protein [Gemmatimonadales bacterium]|nr:tetratricopeptide repeat protein [Gemmatimonadales bacterium]
MRKLILAIGVLVLVGTGAAQAQILSDRVAKAMPSRYQPPDCKLKGGHFMVGSGATYLKSGTETSVEGNRVRLFSDAKRVLTEAITEKGQAENGAAWYYLGRTYLMEGDVIGADSAFTKAEGYEPECAAEIKQLRRVAWVALVQPATQFLEKEATDSAVALLRLAQIIYRDEPNAMYVLGIYHSNEQQLDSAIVYFKQAAEVSAKNPALTEQRNKSTFNMAVLLSNAGRYPEAVEAWRQYTAWVPDDVDGKKGLAQAFRGANMPDSAMAIEAELVSAAGAGGELDATASTGDLFSFGVNAFNAKNYDAAIKAFSIIRDREPNNRDAVFNLANSYYAIQDTTNLIAAAQELVRLDPMNEYALKLLGEGYRLAGNTEQLVKIVTEIEASPFNLDVKTFTRTEDGATLVAQAVGREAKDIEGRPLKVTPTVLAVEFLAEGGSVVSSEEVTVPQLEAGAVHDVTVKAAGPGIVAWRYAKKEM